MTSRDFCYWLQGFFELSGTPVSLDAGRVQTIQNHLNMVFKHEIDPSHGDAAHQAALSGLHQGGAAGNTPKPKPAPSKSRPEYPDGPIKYRC